LASVTPDRVRNRVNLSSSDIGDSVVTEFIVDACAEIMLETGRSIDYQNCDQVEVSCMYACMRASPQIFNIIFSQEHQFSGLKLSYSLFFDTLLIVFAKATRIDTRSDMDIFMMFLHPFLCSNVHTTSYTNSPSKISRNSLLISFEPLEANSL